MSPSHKDARSKFDGQAAQATFRASVSSRFALIFFSGC
jgi:hypothetical protein